ncbi:amidohydrolase family protein [Paenibacillus marinisediminis]
MTKRYKIRAALLLALLAISSTALFVYRPAQTDESIFQPTLEQNEIETLETATTKPHVKTLEDWTQQYKDMKLVDAHNHSATNYEFRLKIDRMWNRYGVDRIVLFGNVSDPSAVYTDEIAWEAYQQHPERFIPFASGINLLEESGVQVAEEYLEKGFFGLGELAVASTYSEALAHSSWKTQHPMDGFLPDIYELCAQYKAPILMHIDPPEGYPILKLEEAAKKYPDTIFIFAHANAYNSPDNIRSLLKEHSNVYADFFEGFTAFNPSSAFKLEDYVPVIKEFPDRFLISTDSGYGISSEKDAIQAMYMLLEAIDDPEVAMKIASGNIERLIREQMATRTQLTAIRQLENKSGKKYDTSNMSKEQAGKLLIEESKKLSNTQ